MSKYLRALVRESQIDERVHFGTHTRIFSSCLSGPFVVVSGQKTVATVNPVTLLTLRCIPIPTFPSFHHSQNKRHPIKTS